jgi:hypothetical protein
MRGDSFMMIYLAGAIDMVSKEEGMDWRLTAIEELRKIGVSTFNPMAAFGYVNLEDPTAASALVRINEAALFQCSAAIFMMSPEQPSIGTPIELFACHHRGIPHVVIWATKDWSVPLPAYLRRYGDKIVGSVKEAVTHIKKLKEQQITGATIPRNAQ